MLTTDTGPATTPAEGVLVISRVVHAPRALVYRAWTDPEIVKRWWGPHGYTTPVCRIDLRPGGRYQTCMRSPDGRDFWGQGVFREIVESERLVFTDSFTDENGNVVGAEYYGMSPTWPREAQVLVTFADQGNSTELTVLYGGLKDVPEADREGARQGWTESLEKFAEILERAAPS